jgi:hypothetical protein
MIGDKGFEFFNNRDARKFVQIPWEEVDYVIASVVFKGKWIPRYAIQTKKNGTYSFASKEPKKVLRAIREYVDPDHMVRSLGFFDVIKRGVRNKLDKRLLILAQTSVPKLYLHLIESGYSWIYDKYVNEIIS